MSEVIVANIIVLSSIAVAAAIILYFAAQKFKTESNPVADEIAAMLPQANCGACGKAGCQDFANACAAADAESFARLYCPVGGAKVMTTVAARLGYSSAEHEPTVAVLHCNGTCENAPDKVEYIGLQSCRLANRAFVGKTGCPDGCLRLGDCVRNCPFGAIEMNPQTGLRGLCTHLSARIVRNQAARQKRRSRIRRLQQSPKRRSGPQKLQDRLHCLYEMHKNLPGSQGRKQSLPYSRHCLGRNIRG